jgi:hypothetical protein
MWYCANVIYGWRETGRIHYEMLPEVFMKIIDCIGEEEVYELFHYTITHWGP